MQNSRGPMSYSMQIPDFITLDADGQIRLTGHRVGIQDIAFFYNEGYSAEMLLCQFPTLSLALIHKTLGFYLDQRAEIDAYVAACNGETESHRAAARHGPSLIELRERLATKHATPAH